MPDSEKITINMNAVDLGKIDLLVQEGVFSNRTDFIRTAIRNQLDKHVVEIQQSVRRNDFGIGVFGYGRSDLEKMRNKGERLNIKVIGLVAINANVPPELAAEVIESVKVRGVFNASFEVKAALSKKMK